MYMYTYIYVYVCMYIGNIVLMKKCIRLKLCRNACDCAFIIIANNNI